MSTFTKCDGCNTVNSESTERGRVAVIMGNAVVAHANDLCLSCCKRARDMLILLRADKTPGDGVAKFKDDVIYGQS